MMMHSCCCMLFSCIVWFEITFQNDLNLHSKIWVGIRKRNRKGILLLSFYSAYWPSSPVAVPACRPISFPPRAAAFSSRLGCARAFSFPARPSGQPA